MRECAPGGLLAARTDDRLLFTPECAEQVQARRSLSGANSRVHSRPGRAGAALPAWVDAVVVD